MPALKNRRHEAFAQACAKGASASNAYRATYGTNAKNIDTLSSRLALSGSVGKRIIEIQADAEHHTHLSISEKRSMLAKESRDTRNSLKDRIAAMDADSKLAGHIKLAEAGGVHVNVNVAMLTEDRRKELIQRKRASVERKRQRMATHTTNGANGHN